MSNTNDRAPVGANDSACAPASDRYRHLFKITRPLLPVGPDGRCTCGQEDCRRPGKHPARNAPEGHGYAVVTGAESGVFVVDCDVKGGTDGIEQFRRFLGLKDGEAFPHTLTVATGSGGLHFYFTAPGFHVSGTKLDTAIDIKGDKDREDGLVYVVGPGSPGYVTNKERTVATKGIADYELLVDAPIADAPELLLSWLRIHSNGKREDAFAPTPIDDTHPDWDRRVDLAIEACKTMPESKGDGQGGTNLLRVCLKLIRTLELPEAHALELIETFFNPRCTSDRGEHWPWSEEDIAHKIEDARDRSSLPCGVAHPSFAAMIKARSESSRRAPPTPAPPGLNRIAALHEQVPDAIVTVTDEMHLAVDEGRGALAKSSTIFQREGRLIQPLKIADAVSWARESAEGVPTIRQVPPATLATELTRVAAWQKYDGRSKAFIRTQPPDRIVAAISEAGSWPGVRVLHRIVEAPLMRADGTILQAPGYDAATATIYDPCGVDFALVPDAPSFEEAREALALLREPFEEFPFATDADALVPVAVILTSLAMGALDGANFPCFAFDANVQGTGKTLCADACSWILTGREVPKQTFPSEGPELEKLLGGAALAATPMLCLDNINGTFGGDALEQRMTCRGTSQFRMLGKNDNRTLPWRTILLASGNNLRPTVDMRRRIIRCRLVSQVENPEQRTIKRSDLRGWVRARRPALVVAGLTLLRAFVAAGRPPQSIRRMGNFEEWGALVAGALKWVSDIDVLDARMPEASVVDPATEAYAQFLSVSEIGKARTSREISMMSCWNELIPADDRDRAKRVGMLLAKMLERPIGDLRVEHGPKHATNVQTYRVVRVAA